MKRCIQTAGAIALLGAAVAAKPAMAGSCNDAWITQAVREVTGSYPTGSGSSGDCSPDFYATNRGAGHWSSYQDLLNKVRVKKTRQGAVYVFLAPNQAAFNGHVAWGYVTDDGRYVWGSTDQKTWNTFELVVQSGDQEKDMVQWFKDRFRGQSFAWQTLEYTEYRVGASPGRNTAAAERMMSSIRSYWLTGNNCMDHTYKMLEAYGMTKMPWPQTNWAPRKWFADFPGVWHHVNEVARGKNTKPAVVPVSVQKASSTIQRVEPEIMATLRGVGFVNPLTVAPRPTTITQMRSAYARVTSAAKNSGRAKSPLVRAGVPKAPRRQLVIARGSNLPAGYRGIAQLVPFSSEGTPNPSRASGQAAIATVVNFYSLAFRRSSTPLVNEVYASYRPDIAQGIQGTSWQQMSRAIRSAHLTPGWYRGTDALKSALAQNMPSIVLLDVSGMPGFNTWGGHWTVAYAYDKDGVYLSNWPGDGKISWADLGKAWNTPLTRADGTANLFLCAQKPEVSRKA